MNDKTNTPSLPGSEPQAPATDAVEAQPVKARKPRARKVVADVQQDAPVAEQALAAEGGEAAGTAEVAAAGDAADAAPVKRARRPRKPKADVDAESGATSQAGVDPVESSPRDAVAAEPVAPVAAAASDADAAPQSDAHEQAPRSDDASAAEPVRNGPAGGAGVGLLGANKRRRQRAAAERAVVEQQPESAGSDVEEDEADGARAPAVFNEAPAPLLFSDVISGQFDADEEDENLPSLKRVLQPQPETPKLHKVLAQAGLGSRLEMEKLIADGKIFVNNEPAHVGQRIQFGDQIKVDGKPIRYRIAPPPPRVLAYHKPVGEVVTHDDPQNRPTVFRRLPKLYQGKWQSVGRLDLNTEGLLLFTSSGELANRLMHPRFGLQREYAVRVLGALNNEEKQQLLDGVRLDDGMAQFQSIEDGGGDGANCWYRVTIAEGRNREVRRLLESVGHAVSRLIRIRYGAVMLPRGLKRGAWLELDEREIRQLTEASGGPLATDSIQQPRPGRGNRQQQGNGRGGRNNKQGGQQGGQARNPQGGGQQQGARFEGEGRGGNNNGGNGGNNKNRNGQQARFNNGNAGPGPKQRGNADRYPTQNPNQDRERDRDRDDYEDPRGDRQPTADALSLIHI